MINWRKRANENAIKTIPKPIIALIQTFHSVKGPRTPEREKPWVSLVEPHAGGF